MTRWRRNRLGLALDHLLDEIVGRRCGARRAARCRRRHRHLRSVRIGQRRRHRTVAVGDATCWMRPAAPASGDRISIRSRRIRRLRWRWRPLPPFSADANSPRLTEPSPSLSSLQNTSSALSRIGAAGAKRGLEFRFGELAVAIAIDLREQVLQRIRAARRTPRSPGPGLALRSEQRAHGCRRDLRTLAATAGPALAPVEAEASRKKSNRLAWRFRGLSPDDDFEDVSALRASIAEEAAPRTRT